MTHQNKAREALELLSKIQGLLILSNSVRTGQSIGDTHDVDELFSPIRSILERLEGVDRVALREALAILDRKRAKVPYPEVAFATLEPVDFVNIEKAARIVADMGEWDEGATK